MKYSEYYQKKLKAHRIPKFMWAECYPGTDRITHGTEHDRYKAVWELTDSRRPDFFFIDKDTVMCRYVLIEATFFE